MPRKIEFDILKGILIILVVIGHTLSGGYFLHTIIYWFHMPVFFMLTGILSTWGCDNIEFVKKRFLSYVVPYFSWCVLLYLLFLIENPFKYLARIIYAGSMNTTSYTYPFWFVCALFLGSVVFNALYCKCTKWLLGGLGVYLLLWYGFLHTVHIPMLPWSAEVVPFVLVYFIVGIYINSFSDKLNSGWQAVIYSVAIILAIGMIMGEYYNLFGFKLSMKNLTMHNFLLDVLVPIIFFIALKGICIQLCNMRYLKNALSYIGQSSLVIMFTHPAVMHIVRLLHLNVYENFVILILSVIFGCMIYLFCKKNKRLSFLFLGKKKF